ncbi:hypothetical protein OG407_16855 [Streptomyces sp. NBC_01515]|uniref:hypothetical protein n=1 Tax=Streptomyces sp. NBC_01515 TaxID=2903890 RepID=UPI00386DC78C
MLDRPRLGDLRPLRHADLAADRVAASGPDITRGREATPASPKRTSTSRTSTSRTSHETETVR